MIPQYKGASAATTIMMSRKFRETKTLLVEGVNEVNLFKDLFPTISVLSADGQEGVYQAISELNDNKEEKARGIHYLGMIDQDYLKLADYNKILENEKIISTNYRDLEIDILHSQCLKRFLEEKASPNKYGCEKEVLKNILDNLKLFSYLRAFNYIKIKNWDFKVVDLSKSSDRDANINYTKVISNFKQSNKITADEWKEFEEFMGEKEFDLRMITRGHDTTTILGKMLKRKIGSKSDVESKFEVVEENLRLAVKERHLEGYEWYQIIKEFSR